MQELIIQPDESLVLPPGGMIEADGKIIEAGSEPLRIRFGLINFTVEEGSTQHQLLSCIAQYLKHAAPTGWRIETVRHIRQLAELVGDANVTIIPHSLARKRTAKKLQYAEHQIDIIVVGKLDTDSTVALLDRWIELFLDGGGPLDFAPCMDAVTLDEASAGYSVEALTNTPSMFIGGLRLTFWIF